MPVPPLTHHEILELVGPFARRGRLVDLAATHRIDRRVVFKPVDHGATLTLAGLRETLELESLGTGTCVLTRVLAPGNGLKARLRAMGPHPGDLLASIEAVPPQQQFRSGPGYTVACSYEVDRAGARRVLTDGVVLLDGLRLTLTLAAVRGSAAEIALVPAPGDPLEVPEDLLAVLGWDWARLIRNKDGWRTRLRLRGDLERRSRNAERALERAASHLAECLAEAPASFHDRWTVARWGVAFRRAIPLLTFVALVATVLCLPHVARAGGSELWMLWFQVPTALIALSFCLQELPQYEIPPLPRRSSAASWRRRPDVGGTAGRATQ
jgi:hypothetical protein